MALFNDAFTRANAGTLGATWNSDTDSNWDLSGNAAVGQDVGGLVTTTTSAHAATADVKVTVTQVGSSGDGGVAARITAASAASRTGYATYVSASGINCYRHNSGVDTLLIAGAAITQVANGVIAMQIVGSALEIWYQGVSKGTATDGSPLSTAGRTGMVTWSGIGTNSTYDDFQVDDMTPAGGGVVIPVFMNQYRQRRA